MAASSHERWKCGPAWLIVVCYCDAGSDFAIRISSIVFAFRTDVVDCCVIDGLVLVLALRDG